MAERSRPKHSSAASSLETRRKLRVLVSGASGFLGTHLREFLGDAGHEVFQLVRRRPNASGQQIGWDPGAGTIDRGALEGFDAVIHLSGEDITGRWTAAKKQRIRDSRVLTTRLLAEALASLQRRPHVFVCASAIGYYGNRGTAKLTESDPPGSGFLAGVCQEWEAATEPASKAGIRVVNPRIGVVLAPDGGALARMLPIFRMGMGGVVGSGDQWLSWIALSDLLRIFEFVIRNDSLSGPVNAVSPQPVTNREFTKAIGSALKRPTLVPLPATAVRLTMGQMGEETLLASARVVPERLLSAGFEFLHSDLEEALQFEMSGAGSAQLVSH